MGTRQNRQTWFKSDSIAEFSTISLRGHTSNQHPHLAFHGMPPSTRSTSAHALPQLHLRPLAGQVHSNPGIDGNFCRHQMLPNPHHTASTADYLTTYLPRGGGRPMVPSDHNTPTHMAGIPSQLSVSGDPLVEQTHCQRLTNPSSGSHTWQSNCQTATLPPRSPLQFEDIPMDSDTTILPTYPVSSSVFPERTFITTPSSPHDRGWKETPAFATGACPSPTCRRRFGRTQDLERHIHRHLSRCICCTQPKCSWTGSRRCALRDHYRKKHQGVPVPGQETSRIYDARALIKQLLKGEITLDQAKCGAHSSFRSRAAEVGKLGIWRE